MAAVTVFVDDAVLGRLPYLCVKTGIPGEGLLTIHTPVRGQTGLGVWWLLVLASPLGWLGLLVIAAMSSGGGEILTVQLPWTEAAQHQVDEAKRRRRNLWLACAGIVGMTVVILGLGDGAGFTGQLAAVLLLAVTLDDVHHDFAHAVETSRSDRHPAAP